MKITVITVCFNSAETIADTLASIDAQVGVEVEHIVVDGASRDSTLQILNDHPRPWRRIVSEPDKGLYDAMNKGLRLASGEVVGFLNSDDFYASHETLARVASVFADVSVDGCYGDLCYVKREEPSVIVRYWRSSPFEPGLFRKGWCPPHPTLFLRRKLYERYGGFNLEFQIAADMELMARFLEVRRAKTVYLPEVIVKMRTGGASNHSVSNVVLQNREIWRAMQMHNMGPSVLSFLSGKALARCRQFLSRPS